MEIISDSNFEEKILKSSGPTFLGFWAEWCSPCHMINPYLDELDLEYQEKNITIARCNVDENSKTIEEYDIKNIPTFIIFHNGQERERFTGGLQKEKLIEAIEKYLDN